MLGACILSFPRLQAPPVRIVRSCARVRAAVRTCLAAHGGLTALGDDRIERAIDRVTPVCVKLMSTHVTECT